MYAHSFSFPDIDPLPLLDKEFDRVDITPQSAGHAAFEPVLLCDDRAWEDQLDDGEEMSL